MHLGHSDHYQARRDTPWLQRTVTPASRVSPPVTVDEFAAWLEDPCPPESGDIRHDQWTELLTLATDRIVEVAAREIMQRDIEVSFDAYASGRIPAGGLITQALPRPAWLTIPRVPADPDSVAVEVYAGDGTAATVDPSRYQFDAVSVPHRIHIEDPPIYTELPRFRGIRVSFTAGYASTADVPAPLRLAVLMYAAWLYERRGESSDAGLSASGALDAIGDYRVRVGL